MLFNSLQFAVFFPAAALICFVIPKKLRCLWLLLASYVFYMSANPKYAVLLLFTTVVTYAGGLLLGRVPENRKKAVLALVFAACLAVLALFKYFDFLLGNLNTALGALGFGAVSSPFRFALPLGISFYTFQALGYLVDVYRGDTEPERNILRYGLFVSFFPVILSGPIERSTGLLRQIRELPEKALWKFERVRDGLTLILFGLFQKMVIADRIAILADQVFDNYRMYEMFALMTGAAAYAIQIYCDFASYSLMAFGVAKVLDFGITENFNTPYFSRSMREFWRRWHISLSSWFRDYLYIPLGGNRCGKIRRYFNLMATFLVSGLWHGASWSYVAWGGLHGLYQIIGYELKGVKEKINGKLHTKTEALSYRLGQVLVTFGLTAFAWIFFRSPSIGTAFDYIRRMVTKPDFWSFFNGELYNLGLDRTETNVLIVSLAALFLVELVRYFRKQQLDAFLAEQNLWFRWAVLLALIGAVAVFGIYGPGYDAQQFIYFQF